MNKFYRLLPKIKLQKMQSSRTFSPQLFNCLNSVIGTQEESTTVFQKYKSGSSLFFSAFRLYSTDVSCEEQSSQESDEEGNKARGCYRKYTRQEKEIAVSKILNGHDVTQISKEYGIPRRNLLRWRKNGCQRKEGGGRPTDHELERILYEKLEKQEIKGEKQIRAFAKQVSLSQNFKASKGWYSKFCRRYKLQTGKQLQGG